MSVHFWLWFSVFGFVGFFVLVFFFFNFMVMMLLFQGSFSFEIFAVSAWHRQFSVWDNGGLVFREFSFV